VVRTNPNVILSRQPRIKEMMTTILFVYAKKHPQMSYKQGMHELLAVLLQMQQGLIFSKTIWLI